jgi:hypothetical protein
VSWLHDRQYAKPGKTWNVFLIKDLGMLDPESQIGGVFVVAGESFLVGVQGNMVRTISNRMDAQLKSAGNARVCEVPERIGRRDSHAACGGIVRIRLDEGGAV